VHCPRYLTNLLKFFSLQHNFQSYLWSALISTWSVLILSLHPLQRVPIVLLPNDSPTKNVHAFMTLFRHTTLYSRSLRDRVKGPFQPRVSLTQFTKLHIVSELYGTWPALNWRPPLVSLSSVLSQVIRSPPPCLDVHSPQILKRKRGRLPFEQWITQHE
jgi:hypothetical protein